MGRPILADYARPVNRKDHRHILQTDIMYYLIISPLDECRIDCYDGLQPPARQTGRKGRRVLLGNTDIIKPVWIFLGKARKPGSFSHRRSYGYDPAVL